MNRRLLPALLVTLLASGCGLVLDPGGGPDAQPPVSGEELGPIFPAPNGGPPIECRGVPRAQCESPGAFEDGVGGVRVRDVERVIVTCTSPNCDSGGGEFRIDVLLPDGTTQEIGAGGYGSTEALP